MLESIRSGAQSFGVKIAFGIIILVFVFWGVGNFNERDYTNVVAVVNGEPILAIQFEKAYQNAEEFVLRNNPGLSREELEKQHFGRQVLREIIQETLLAQEAQRAGINVTPLELRYYVNNVKAFQDNNGKFSPDLYTRALASQRISPAQYEQDLATQLLRDKIYNLVTSSTWIDPDEAFNRFNYLREKRQIDYIFIPSDKFLNDVKVSDDQAKEWYNSHKNDYIIPAKVDVSYINVSPENVIDKNTITNSEIQSWYDKNKNQYVNKEQIKVSHLLVPVSEDADKNQIDVALSQIENLKLKLNSGMSFAKALDEYNKEKDPSKGGDLGWISRGETIPQFEEIAFSLEPGKYSDIVKTPFGFHLIYVEDKKESDIKDLDEVKSEIINSIATEKGSSKIHDVIDNLIEDNILMKPLDESAKKYGLKNVNSGYLSKDEIIGNLGISPQDADLILSTPAGEALDTALSAGNAYVIARVMQSKPAAVQPYEDVKESIIKLLRERKSVKKSMEVAKDILKKIINSPVTNQEVNNENIVQNIIVERGGLIASFAPDQSLIDAIFDSKQHEWLSEPHEVVSKKGTGAILVYINKILPPENSEYKTVENILSDAVKKDRQDSIFSVFMQNLFNHAKIEIKNQTLVDRNNK